MQLILTNISNYLGWALSLPQEDTITYTVEQACGGLTVTAQAALARTNSVGQPDASMTACVYGYSSGNNFVNWPDTDSAPSVLTVSNANSVTFLLTAFHTYAYATFTLTWYADMQPLINTVTDLVNQVNYLTAISAKKPVAIPLEKQVAASFANQVPSANNSGNAHFVYLKNSGQVIHTHDYLPHPKVKPLAELQQKRNALTIAFRLSKIPEKNLAVLTVLRSKVKTATKYCIDLERKSLVALPVKQLKHK